MPPQTDHYYLPEPSYWPIVGSLSLLCLAVGATLAIHSLGGGGWPTAGPGIKEHFTPMAAWGIPAINTLILLSSGGTVTWAHWAMKFGNRTQLKLGLLFTICLGISFLTLQAHEYVEAYQHLGLNLGAGIYGATFFMLTGFHGLHVTIGTLMLIVILGRCLAGHFSTDNHFGFEAVSWYWHFVDVVWLMLFVFVYWL